MYLNYYSLPLIALVIILAILLFQVRKHKDATGTTCFSLLLICITIYSFFYALEISSSNFKEALNFYKLEYIGIPFVPAFFLTFTIRYTGKKRWLNTPAIVALFSVPLTSMILVFTTGEHNLYHEEIFLSNETIFPALVFEPGIWYTIQQFYSILCILFAQLLLLNMWIEVMPAFRKQVTIVMTGSIIPFITLLLYLSGLFSQGVDPIPYSLTFCVLIIYLGMTRYKLLDITPLARSVLFDRLPEGVIVLDEMKRIVDCNSSAANYLQITQNDIGKIANKVLDSWPEIISPENTSISKKKDNIIVRKNIHENDFWFSLEFLPLTIENDDRVGQMIIISDITESKKAEEKLLETNRDLARATEHAQHMTARAEMANRTKTEFLANMSHEIRTPLNGIIGFSDILMDTDLKESQLNYLNIVYNSANKLLMLINDLLDFSTIESGDFKLNNEQVQLEYLLKNIISDFEQETREKKLKIRLNLATKIPEYVITDHTRLKQILIKLLDNAVKFTEEGEIELRVETFLVPGKQNDMRFKFSIIDTGIGIYEEDKIRIFESFSQADGSTTRKYGGTGMGLSLSNRLLELMDSKLELESEPGKGSTFFFEITLPYKINRR